MQFVRRAIRQVTLAPPFVGRRVGGPSRGFLPRARQQRGYPFLLGRPLAIMSTLRTKPASPSDVLDFWFGGHWGTENMADPQVLASQNPLWWGVSADMTGPISPEEREQIDADCCTFVPLIRSSGEASLEAQSEEWATPDGQYAQVILCDQLSRNSFRGTAEAFAYDARAVQLVRGLFESKVYEDYHLPQFMFLTTPGQHSEHLADHEMNEAIVQFMKQKFGDGSFLVNMLAGQCKEHKEVIDKFGRYPHRNALHGRVCTPEEEAWLADVDNLPSWALSQMPKK